MKSCALCADRGGPGRRDACGASQAWALGLGRLSVQSALGETLRAEIDVTSLTAEEASSLKLRVAPPEAYRAAGVEYNAALANAQVQAAAPCRRPAGAARHQRPRAGSSPSST
jgi:Tfp pilus assembly protein FimV